MLIKSYTSETLKLTSSITIIISLSPSAELQGVTECTISNEECTFSNLSINIPGTYQLIASCDGCENTYTDSMKIELFFQAEIVEKQTVI